VIGQAANVDVYPTADTYISQQDPNTNFFFSLTLMISKDNMTYLSFDLNNIIFSNMSISQVTLYLAESSPSNGDILNATFTFAYINPTTWFEQHITWSVHDEVIFAEDLLTFQPATAFGSNFYSVDIPINRVFQSFADATLKVRKKEKQLRSIYSNSNIPNINFS